MEQDPVARQLAFMRCEQVAQQEQAQRQYNQQVAEQQRANEQAAREQQQEARIASQQAQQRAREQAADRRAAEQQAASDAANRRNLELRQQAQPPPLGSTRAEASVTCARQGGQFEVAEVSPDGVVARLACVIGERDAYMALERDGFIRVTAKIAEGADFDATQRAANANFGPAISVHVNEQGFRAWTWRTSETTTVEISMHPDGVVLIAADNAESASAP